MHLKSLILRNYRGFSSLDLQLNPTVNVLVGVNGAGKTSVLDAIAKALLSLTTAVPREEAVPATPDDKDVRAGASEASIQITADFDGPTASWSCVKTLPGHISLQKSDMSELKPIIEAAKKSITNGEPRIPLAVYFPTNRNALDIPARIRTPHEFDALSAYDGALENGASNFRGFFEWYRGEEDLYNEQRVAQPPPPESERSRLPIVRSAIEKLFKGAESLRIERRPQRMTIERNNQRVDVSMLSDGEKCLLSMVGDLARRLVLAAPAEPYPLLQRAVVLIDEVELHLHPGLQRTMIPRIREVFPNVQIICTTHSPQVLSSVRAENVRIIENFALRPLEGGTWHRDTNRILETGFGDLGRPRDVADKMLELRNAVDEDRVDDARALIRTLRDMMEGDDPDIFFLESLLPPVGDTESEDNDEEEAGA